MQTCESNYETEYNHSFSFNITSMGRKFQFEAIALYDTTTDRKIQYSTELVHGLLKQKDRTLRRFLCRPAFKKNLFNKLSFKN